MQINANVTFDFSQFLGELLITQAKLEVLTSIVQTKENELQIKLALRPKYVEVLRNFNENYPNVIQDFDNTIQKIIDSD